MKFANDTLPNSNTFVEMQKKIGSMVLVFTEIGVFAGVIGALMTTGIGAIILGAGLAAIVSIASSLALTSIQIKVAVQNMPSNLDSEKEKLINGIKFISEIKKEFGGGLGGILGGIKNFFVGNGTAEFDSYVEMAQKLASITKNLNEVSKDFPSNLDDTLKNKISDALNWVNDIRKSIGGDSGAEGGIWGGIKNWWSNKNGMQNFEAITKITETLKAFADNLLKLKDIGIKQLNKVVDSGIFSTLKLAMGRIQAEFMETGGIWTTINDFFENQSNTSKLDNTLKVSETLTSLIDNLSKIQLANPNKINIAIDKVFPVLKIAINKIKEEFMSEGGFVNSIKGFMKNNESFETLEKAKEISEKLTSLVDNLSKIGDVDLNKLNNTLSENGIIYSIKNAIIILKNTFVDNTDSIKNTLNNSDISYISKSGEIVDSISKMGQALSGIGDIKLDIGKVNVFIDNMKSIIVKIVSNFGKENDIINFNEEIVDGIKKIEEVALSISNMSKSVNEMQQVDLAKASDKLTAIKGIIEKILNIFVPGKDSYVDISPIVENEVDSNIGKVLNVLNTMSSMAKTANEMAELDMSKINPKIDSIKNLIIRIKDVFLGEDVKFVDLINQIGTLDLNPITNIVNSLKGIADTVNAFPDAQTGAKNLSSFSDALVIAITNIATKLGLVDVVGTLKLAGSNLADSILNGFNEKINAQTPNTINTFSDLIVNKLNENDNKFVEAGRNSGLKLFEGFINISNEKANEMALNITNNITNPFHHQYQINYNNAGEAIVVGLAYGISSSIWRINQAMGNVSNSAIDKLKSLLGIHSPSKVFYSLGENIGEGLANGIESMIDTVSKQTQNLVKSVNFEMNQLNDVNLSLDKTPSNSQINKTNNIYMNNNINNEMDLSSVMGQLKWQITRA